MRQSWRWAGACSVGSSHIKSGRGCQDRASCVTLTAIGHDFISAVISDGAGSASESATGAAIVCRNFQRLLIRYLRQSSALGNIDSATIADWVDDIRERINAVSGRADRKPRDY